MSIQPWRLHKTARQGAYIVRALTVGQWYHMSEWVRGRVHADVCLYGVGDGTQSPASAMPPI
jgi:hypothetical protein